MNKSLETEYKEQVRIDLPDLWGKIEEKLDAQAVQTNVTEFPKTVASAQNVEIDKTEKKEKLEKIFADEPKAEIRKENVVPIKKKKSIPWHYFGLAAAAVLCMLVVIPAMSNMRGASTTMEKAPSATVQTANSSTGAAAMEAPAAAGDSAATTDMMAQTESVEEAEESISYTDDVTEDLAEVPQSENNKKENASYSATDSNESVTQGDVRGAAAEECEDADGAAPGATAKDTSVTDKCDILVLLAVSEGTTDEQLSQLMKDLKKSVDPDFSITMISKEDAEYADYIDLPNDRISHLIVLDGAKTDDQILDQIEFLWLKLKDYDYVQIRDIQHRELNYED